MKTLTKKILLLGSNSFAAKGLSESLINKGFDVDVFFRGIESKDGSKIFGDVFTLSTNKYLNEQYDTIINFIIIKNSSVEENLRYIKELITYCKEKKVRHLIQISSISVYPNNTNFINEKYPIEEIYQSKGIYAAVKVAVDKYLMSVLIKNFHISFVRPGFIIKNDAKPSLAGILKAFPFGIGLLLGSKKTTLPIIDRQRFHNAILKILLLNLKESVYLILANNKSTKYSFVQSNYNYKVIALPKRVTLILAKAFFTLRIFNKKQFKQVEGLFKTTVFDSTHTEDKLNIKF